MGKIEDFKNFVKKNPRLIRYIKNEEMSWQKFYEIYDLYGEDEKVWEEFLKDNKESNTDNNTNPNYIEDIIKTVKNIDVDKVQDSITSLQKTLSLFGDLFASHDSTNTTSSNYRPRPLYRKFED